MSSLVPTARACALFSFRRVEAEAPTKQWAHAASFDLPENPSTLWQRGERETTQLDENGSQARYPKLNGCDVEAIRVMEELGRLEDGTPREIAPAKQKSNVRPPQRRRTFTGKWRHHERGTSRRSSCAESFQPARTGRGSGGDCHHRLVSTRVSSKPPGSIRIRTDKPVWPIGS